ncbi:unnamed protein product [Bemisia tabaci]|uniref:Lipase domain-containing protein n=1 Tax=Bemisia tabaci TaxID=7038 RepID=A0A9P0CCP5_BEMTA|nr:unnamed protein product [Bemisia tabaci]
MVFSGLMLCSTYLYFSGFENNPFSVRVIPKGYCFGCCPVNDDEDITFNLYTRKNAVNPQLLRIGDQGILSQSNLDERDPTVIYIHGFSEQGTGPSAMAIKNAYMSRGDFNVIVVDWNSLGAFPWYSHAVSNTRLVAAKIAHLLQFLHLTTSITLDRVHVIGFSLGAEIAGYVGKSLSLGKLYRITGLDPAFPLYYFQGARGRLAASDASFVDVIHTDGAVFGFPTPMGHADFYPNGGIPPQPGCAKMSSKRQLAIFHFNIRPSVVACSHNRAWRYYAESVRNPYGFRAIKCTEVSFVKGLCISEIGFDGTGTGTARSAPAVMGFAANPNLRGQFYLQTNGQEPFAQYPPVPEPVAYEDYNSEELEDVENIL